MRCYRAGHPAPSPFWDQPRFVVIPPSSTVEQWPCQHRTTKGRCQQTAMQGRSRSPLAPAQPRRTRRCASSRSISMSAFATRSIRRRCVTPAGLSCPTKKGLASPASRRNASGESSCSPGACSASRCRASRRRSILRRGGSRPTSMAAPSSRRHRWRALCTSACLTPMVALLARSQTANDRRGRRGDRSPSIVACRCGARLLEG
jgi:hypothetical protein